mmetsp:Transcript_4694/g.6658  ORF Transcript_4694/g.6658 Transcript_4694/m.6658 type:complete len:89 (+) Transcript_4694:2701-2967(+)
MYAYRLEHVLSCFTLRVHALLFVEFSLGSLTWCSRARRGLLYHSIVAFFLLLLSTFLSRFNVFFLYAALLRFLFLVLLMVLLFNSSRC